MELAKCPREENFREMYSALGDAARQQEIRDANRDHTHCMFLRESAEACNELPESGGPHAGKICPNNPWERESALFDQLEEQGLLLQEARYIADMSSLGHLPGPERLCPAEWEVARIMNEYERMRMFQLNQASTLAGALGSGTSE